MGNWANFNAVKARSIFKFVQLKYIESLFKKQLLPLNIFSCHNFSQLIFKK